MAKSFRDIIGLWENPQALASDVGAKVQTVLKWRQRSSIPATWWNAILRSSVSRKAGVTGDQMAAIAARGDGSANAR